MRKLIKPGKTLGSYPEKPRQQSTILKSIKYYLHLPSSLFGTAYTRPYKQFVKKINLAEVDFKTLSDEAFYKKIKEHRAQLSLQDINPNLSAISFALVKQTVSRTLGITPFNTQLIAASMIYDGKLVEMATGEGKTLTAGISAAAVALAGIPVHLITANDYLVARDAETLAPLYTALGLRVGVIVQGMDTAARKQAYSCNITYCTAKELVFDYLRDQIALEVVENTLHLQSLKLQKKPINTLLNGLYMAIIDEADSILIDEAKVPLLISKNSQHSGMLSFFEQVLSAAKTLQINDDFILNSASKSAELTESGKQKIADKANLYSAIWNSDLYREEMICQALAALYCYKRDQQYLVTEQGIEIIDEITGRLSPGRVWSKGLHQIIELKEGCKPSGELITMTQMTYQRFFSRYLQLGGMSGTLLEAKQELYSTYDLQMKKVPLRLPSQRKMLAIKLFANNVSMWAAAVKRIQEVYATRQALLVGTDSVEDSEHLSQTLTKLNIPHQLLNARQSEQEAQIIATAGQVGQITISTNIAGRGTDIALSKEAKAVGGLHVLSCQHNLSKRIDRQLVGRCSRQGDPGSAQMFYSLDKIKLYQNLPNWIVSKIGTNGIKRPAWLINLLMYIPKWIEEYHQREQRFALFKHDMSMEEKAPSLNSKK
jgi:preprotein translocase subunit SecA